VLTKSSFFTNGFFKKANPCPDVYTKKGQEDHVICGKKAGRSGRWDPSESLKKCNLRISTENPMIVETKFNGHRGIHEFRDGKGCLFTNKIGCHGQLLPKHVNDLLVEHYKKHGITEAITDGEMFLGKCKRGNHIIVPDIGKQHEAISGDHPEFLDNCTFTFKLFDVLKLNDRDVSDLPLTERKKILKKVFPKNIEANIDGRSVMGVNVAIHPIHGHVMDNVDDVVEYACKKTVVGEEGVMLKEPDQAYDWKGYTDKKPSRSGWYKLKEELDIDAEVFRACLGNVGKTGQHAFRYRNIHLGVCADKDCDTLVSITKDGASLSVSGGDFSGFNKWDRNLHDPILTMIKNGRGKPVGQWRLADEVTTKLGFIPNFFDELIGDVKDKDGRKGLPKCVDLPKHEIILSVVGTDVNINENGKPTLQGPPKLHILRPDKKFPNDVNYVLQLSGEVKI